jgi:enterochelin esterase-like enzyme
MEAKHGVVILRHADERAGAEETMKTTRTSLFVASLAMAAQPGNAQTPTSPPPEPPRLVSPEVHADNSVTFRFRSPAAKDVSLDLEGAKPVAMQKDAQGIWTVTTEPLPPDYYGYRFSSGGIHSIDPFNPMLKPNLLETQSVVHVPGSSSLPWETGPGPRGDVHRHFYRSKVVGDERDFYVYTPPGYDPREKQTYPVLYLLHGFSDDAGAWISVGHVNVMVDNLVAQHKAKPMILVMPLGYGAPEILAQGFGGAFRDPALRKRNFDQFQIALLNEVIPQVEKTYRVAKERTSRAIAGLSMGGAESLLTGLNNLDLFAWIGAFSSGGLGGEFETEFPNLDAKANAKLRLLWIACGVDDHLIDGNRKLIAWLTARAIHPTVLETPGAHTWMLWRRHLATFLPMLFR